MLSASSSAQPLRSRRLTWTNQLERHAAMQPDQFALRFRGQSRTWAQLHRRVVALATSLAGLGVSCGERVVIGMSNRVEFLESTQAANYRGAIAVPLNFRLTAAEAELVSLCEPRVIITEADLTDAFDVSGHTDSQPTPLIVVGAATSTIDHGLRYEDLLSSSAAPVDSDDTAEDAPALIMYTSGTTGRPKGAVLTHINMISQVLTVLTTQGVELGRDVWFVGVPLFHIAGVGNLFAGVMLGVPTVIYPSGAFDADDLLDVLETERVTKLFLVPAQWRLVCAPQRVRPRGLHLRAASWGAAPTEESLLREISALFPRMHLDAAFGQTEMSPITCYLDSADALRKAGRWARWSRRCRPAWSMTTCATSSRVASAKPSIAERNSCQVIVRRAVS